MHGIIITVISYLVDESGVRVPTVTHFLYRVNLLLSVVKAILLLKQGHNIVYKSRI